MATVINNPRSERVEDSGTGLGVILGIILVVALAIILLAFGIPALRTQNANPTPAQNATPNGSTINVDLNGGNPTPSPTTNNNSRGSNPTPSTNNSGGTGNTSGASGGSQGSY